MKFLHNGNDGFWVAASEEVATYLGYPAGHFGFGAFMVGRWSGASTNLGTFATLKEAIAAESSVPNLTADRGSPSNALGQHLGNLRDGN